jgi:hypothetical protein
VTAVRLCRLNSSLSARGNTLCRTPRAEQGLRTIELDCWRLQVEPGLFTSQRLVTIVKWTMTRLLAEFEDFGMTNDYWAEG